eukprot:338624_1
MATNLLTDKQTKLLSFGYARENCKQLKIQSMPVALIKIVSLFSQFFIHWEAQKDSTKLRLIYLGQSPQGCLIGPQFTIQGVQFMLSLQAFQYMPEFEFWVQKLHGSDMHQIKFFLTAGKQLPLNVSCIDMSIKISGNFLRCKKHRVLNFRGMGKIECDNTFIECEDTNFPKYVVDMVFHVERFKLITHQMYTNSVLKWDLNENEMEIWNKGDIVQSAVIDKHWLIELHGLKLRLKPATNWGFYINMFKCKCNFSVQSENEIKQWKQKAKCRGIIRVQPNLSKTFINSKTLCISVDIRISSIEKKWPWCKIDIDLWEQYGFIKR